MESNFGVLYNEKDRTIMKIVEDTLNPKDDRVAEIVNFAKGAGFTHIGVANCISFERQGEALVKMLEDEGFVVSRANCKLGRMPNDEILPGYKGVSCNPAGQAFYLAEKNTDMNIVMGLCLGHDMVFNAKSCVPTTTLVVKDRKLNHHSLQRFEV